MTKEEMADAHLVFLYLLQKEWDEDTMYKRKEIHKQFEDLTDIELTNEMKRYVIKSMSFLYYQRFGAMQEKMFNPFYKLEKTNVP